MSEKLSWEEIKKRYPNEWVELVDFEEDEDGYLINGVVICHNANKKRFTDESIKIQENKKHSIRAALYTGELLPLRNFETVDEANRT